MRVEKFLLTPRLDPELNDIESSHRDVSQLDLAAHFARGILDLALCRRECILDRDHDVLVFGRIAMSLADEDILIITCPHCATAKSETMPTVPVSFSICAPAAAQRCGRSRAIPSRAHERTYI